MSSVNLVEVDSSNWTKEVARAEKPVVVEFYTPTCPHCARLTPIFKRLSSEYEGKLEFAMVNAAGNMGLAQGWGVMGVPTLKFFCSGRPVYEIVGYREEVELRQEFDRVIRSSQDCLNQSSPIYV